MNRRIICNVAIAIAIALADLTLCDVARPAWELWQINADGSDLKVFAETPGYTCGSPDWSPDGKLVAFDTWRTNERLVDSKVAVIRADGTDRRLIGPGAMPSWSPDGKQLVCHTYNPHAVVVMNADGSGRETVINHWGSPRWSPKGNRIASILNGGIALYNIATGTELTIFRGPHTVRHGFAISPDGLRFCFGDEAGGLALATLDERTMSATTRWLAKDGMTSHASWAPDGKRVVVSWQPTGAKLSQLYVMNVDSDKAPVLLKGQVPARNNYNPDWSPDGKTIVFVREVPDP